MLPPRLPLPPPTSAPSRPLAAATTPEPALAPPAQLGRAFAVVRRMRLDGAEPNQVTYNTLSPPPANRTATPPPPAPSLPRRASRGTRVAHALVPQRPLLRALIHFRPPRAVHACVLRGELARARQIVRWLVDGQQRGIAGRPPPSVQAFTALIRGYVAPPLEAAGGGAAAARSDGAGGGGAADPGGFGTAAELLEEMIGVGVQPNRITATTLLTAAFDAGNLTAARGLAATLRACARDSDDAELGHATDCALVVGLCRPEAQGQQQQQAAAVASGERPQGRGQARSRARVTEALRLVLAMSESWQLKQEEYEQSRLLTFGAHDNFSHEPRAGRRAAPPHDMRPGDWLCGSCDNHNYADKVRCNRCGLPKKESDALAAPPPADSRPNTRTCNALLAGLVSLGEARAASKVRCRPPLPSPEQAPPRPRSRLARCLLLVLTGPLAPRRCSR